MLNIDITCKIIERENPYFPSGLLSLSNCPLRLYALGDETLLSKISIAIVGTRASSDFGRSLATKVSNELSKYNIVIVSGMADGIDESAHLGSFENGKTIAVVAGGFKETLRGRKLKIAEEILHHNGLIISEYHPDFIVRKAMFLQRNRLIAAISSATAVIEAPIDSGAINTAKHALKLNRPLYVVPWNLNYYKGEGCNLLLSKGAKPLINANQLLSDLQILPTQLKINLYESNKKEKNIPLEYLKYYEFIEKQSPCTLDKILDNFNEEFVGNIISTLTFMELNGYIKTSNKGYYI